MTVKCENCGSVFSDIDIIPLEEVADLGQRLDPGGEVPAGACRKCGALVYVVPGAESIDAEGELNKAYDLLSDAVEDPNTSTAGLREAAVTMLEALKRKEASHAA